MQVFLSWSGDKSKAVAQLLSEWLPQVVQAAEPFISTAIEKGRRWSGEIAERLANAPVGVICVTRENLQSQWLLFEAGAISKPRDGYVCTFLLDVEPADVEPPLGDFQHTRAVKADVYGLVQTINGALALKAEKPLAAGVLERVFERNWPELELRLQSIVETLEELPGRARSDRDILEEVLALVRRADASPATWHNGAIAARLADVPISLEALRSRPNKAFVYTVRLSDATVEQLARSNAELERLEGLVTCRVEDREIECVFLRPAESDLARTLQALGIRAQVVRARSVISESAPGEPAFVELPKAPSPELTQPPRVKRRSRDRQT